MPDFAIINEDSGEFRWHAKNFASAGQNSYDRPPGQDIDTFEQLTNVMPVTQGSLTRRWGMQTWANPGFLVRRFAEYQSDATLTRYIVAMSASNPIKLYNETGGDAYTTFTPSNGASLPSMALSRDVAYFCDGIAEDLKQWDPAHGTRTWGGIAPSLAPSVNPGTTNSGNISLTQGRRYYLVFWDTTLNHFSDLSPISASTGQCEMVNVAIGNLQVSSDPRFNEKILLATADGEDASILYWVANLANGQTTYTDNLSEEDLLLNNVYLETDDNGNEIGVAGNQPPPNGTLLGTHAGRLLMIVNGQYIRVSKNYAETITSTGALTGRYEECWPPEYELDISPGAETVKGWLSDGNSIWIGTNKHIRRVAGTGPEDWETPELAFNNVGLLNQDVWKVVYLEGTPQGSMWLTPDFRVIGSDFNNYRNAGAPIQDVLDSINPDAVDMCHAVSFSSGAFNAYVLAIPTGNNPFCDTLCIFNLKKQRWFIWNLTYPVSSMLTYVTDAGKPKLLLGSAGLNVLPNPSFDSGTVRIPLDSWTNVGDGFVLTDNWQTFDQYGPFLFSISTTGSRGGTNNLLLACDGTLIPGANYGSVWTSNQIAVTPGQQLYISGWMDWEAGMSLPAGVTGFVTFGVRCYRANGSEIGWLDLPGLSGASGWMKQQMYATVPAETAYVHPWCSFYFNNATGAPVYMRFVDGRSQYCRFDQLAVVVLNNNIAQLTGSVADDLGTAIPVTIRTPWYSCGDPQMRKLLQELEVMTDDPNLVVTIEGASTTAEFDNPSIVVKDAPVKMSPFGELKVYLAGLVSKDRFYRLTFNSPSGPSKVVLDSFSLEGFPFHRL